MSDTQNGLFASANVVAISGRTLLQTATALGCNRLPDWVWHHFRQKSISA